MKSELTKLVQVVALGLALVFTFSCSGEVGDNTLSGCPDAVIGDNTVTCGGQTYRTVVIGNQIWIAKNLNYDVNGSVCYGNQESNCNIYGRLYNWETAMKVCPKSWHLPNNAEWDILYRYADSTSGTSSPYSSPTAGRYLKSENGGWNNDGNGEDKYDFSALPGGYGSSDVSFANIGNYGIWWSANEYNSNYAYSRGIYYGDEAYGIDTYSDKNVLHSVRCIKD